MRIAYAQLEPYLKAEFAIPEDSDLRPGWRIQNLDPEGNHWKEVFSAPDSKVELEQVWVDGGWAFVLRQPDGEQFWVTKIDGPDHGLTHYGPFPGDAREKFGQ